MPHRLAVLCAATALGVGLLGAGTAAANDLPVVGTDECTVAVDADTAVQAAVTLLDNAKGLLDLLPATAPLEDRTEATDAVTAADTALAQARTAAALRLCIEAPVETTDPPVQTTDPTPTTEPTTETPAPLTDDKDCRDFNSQEAAQRYFLEHRTAAQPDPDRLDANNNGIACEGAFDEGAAPTTTVIVSVDPTADDGSVADTSGTQVTITPEGSAQTGAA